MVDYADEVALLLKAKCLNSVYILTQGYVNEFTKWTGKNGLAINPNKTELVLFTRKYKISEVTLKHRR